MSESGRSLNPVLSLSWKAMKLYEKVCRQAGAAYHLTQGEIDVLLFLSNNSGCHSAMDIVRYRGVSKPQVSKSVFELMQKNYLAAQKSERDRRYTNLSITREAEQAVVALQNAQKRFIGIIESELTARERAAISAAAAKLNHSLEKYLKE